MPVIVVLVDRYAEHRTGRGSAGFRSFAARRPLKGQFQCIAAGDGITRPLFPRIQNGIHPVRSRDA
jgi:hypothetical protein